MTNRWPEPTRYRWRTPLAVYSACADIVLGAGRNFALDACSTPDNALCRHRADNGLQPWAWPKVQPRTAWMNPPYGSPRNACEPDCQREHEHLAQDFPGTGAFVAAACRAALLDRWTVACLVEAATDAAWWCDHALRASEVYLSRGRISFIHPETGKPRSDNRRGAALLVFRPHVPADGLPGGPRVHLGWDPYGGRR